MEQLPTGQRKSLYFDRERVIQQLVQGLELTAQLRAAVVGDAEGRVNEARASHHQYLTDQISDTLNNALSLLRNAQSSQPNRGGRESLRSSVQATRRRRSYAPSQGIDTWMRDDLKTPFDDGRFWRKYGQKPILGSQHPRDYFRCGLSAATACPARKHVQRVQDDPPVYRTIYFHHHTCHSAFEAALLASSTSDIVAYCAGNGCSNVIRFDDPAHQNPVVASSRPPSVKQEEDKDSSPSSDAVSQKLSSPSDELGVSDLTALESDTGSFEVDMDEMLVASLDFSDVYPAL